MEKRITELQNYRDTERDKKKPLPFTVGVFYGVSLMRNNLIWAPHYGAPKGRLNALGKNY
jgi:hypothetical protein